MAPLKKIKVKSIPKSPAVPKLKPLEVFLIAVGFFAIMAGVLFGVGAVSRFLKESNKKKVDKNGAYINAVVYKKTIYRGRKSVCFK